jgi:hypothetical protein
MEYFSHALGYMKNITRSTTPTEFMIGNIPLSMIDRNNYLVFKGKNLCIFS